MLFNDIRFWQPFGLEPHMILYGWEADIQDLSYILEIHVANLHLWSHSYCYVEIE